MQARVVNAYAEALFETAAAAGWPRAALLEAAGVALPANSDGIPVTDYLRLLNTAAERIPDPAFGLHVGEQFRMSHYAVYGLLLLACRTFREAVEQVMRYESLAHDLGRSELIEFDDYAEYRWHSPWLERCSNDCPGGRPSLPLRLCHDHGSAAAQRVRLPRRASGRLSCRYHFDHGYGGRR